MIKEVIVVEGKMDVVAIQRAIEADCIITHGYGISKETLKRIKYAEKMRGIIIFTDPDSAGERIRRKLAQIFPRAKHAFISKEEGTAHNDIGVEQASPEAIKSALQKVHTSSLNRQEVFTVSDMMKAGLNGTETASQRRNLLGSILGIGYANAKIFLKRLNNYGITKEEFQAGLKKLEG